MRLVTFGRPSRVGLVVDGGVVDVGTALPLEAIVAAWDEHRPVLERRAGGRPLADVTPRLPLRPRRILATGTNCRSHARELGVPPPTAPSAFLKLPGCELGPGEPLLLRPGDTCVDYEGEIAVVLGRPVRDADEDEAVAAIAGLMLANDVSHRDVPTAHIVLAKGGRGFCPLGPALVTPDELDLDAVRFTVRVNGQLRQVGHSGDLVHGIGALVAAFSQAAPLEPGDVILTGTPAGVGVARRPPAFLRPGDEVVISSSQLGTLRTPVHREEKPWSRSTTSTPAPRSWRSCRRQPAR